MKTSAMRPKPRLCGASRPRRHGRNCIVCTHQIQNDTALVTFSELSDVARWMLQECSQVMQGITHHTTLHQVGIGGEIEGVNLLMLGYKSRTELRRSTPSAGVGHKDVGCQRGHKMIS